MTELAYEVKVYVSREEAEGYLKNGHAVAVWGDGAVKVYPESADGFAVVDLTNSILAPRPTFFADPRDALDKAEDLALDSSTPPDKTPKKE